MHESKWAKHLVWHIFLYLTLNPTMTMIILENHKHIICVPQTFNGTKELPYVIIGIDTKAIVQQKGRLYMVRTVRKSTIFPSTPTTSSKVKCTIHLQQALSNSFMNNYHSEWREKLKVGTWFMLTTCMWGLVTSIPLRTKVALTIPSYLNMTTHHTKLK